MSNQTNMTELIRKQQERQAINDKHYITSTFKNTAGAIVEGSKTAKLAFRTANLAIATNLVDMYRDIPADDVEAVSMLLD